ncbi:MAG: hypothetical protein L6V91_04765 [Bacilli bacterium]|nr:MAG: hypothetical protein L6V91_04765 [Bacilli bacterium]
MTIIIKKLSEQELGEEDFYEIYNNKYIIIKKIIKKSITSRSKMVMK